MHQTRLTAGIIVVETGLREKLGKQEEVRLMLLNLAGLVRF